LAQDFRRPVLVQPLGREIPARDRSINREANDGVCGALDEGSKLRVDQLLLDAGHE